MRVDIAGYGAWGLAFGALVARRGADATLLTAPHEDPFLVASSHSHPLAPGVALPANLSAQPREASGPAPGLAVWAVPSKFTEEWLESGFADRLRGIPLLVLSKGLAPGEGFHPLTTWLEERWEAPVATLSGPNFAAEVLAELPAAAVLAGPQEAFAPLISLLEGGPMRIYPSADLLGASLGGVLKNVYAIGGGIVAGASLGDNAAAAFLARALVEMERVWALLGADKATLYGLAGLGDLALSATSPKSRNFALGRDLVKGKALSEAVGSLTGESEGLRTAVRLAALAKAEDLDLPLATVIADVIGGRLDVRGAVARLMGRPIPGS